MPLPHFFCKYCSSVSSTPMEWISSEAVREEENNETTFFCDVEKIKTLKSKLDGNPTRFHDDDDDSSSFFVNRCGLKLASIDHACDYMFTKSDDNNNNNNTFADLCGGPGGFAQYMLWKNCKGFGITLNDDYSPRVTASSSFETYPGDGNLFHSREAFRDWVLARTDNAGVRVVLADGAVSVRTRENDQEALSLPLIRCQYECALGIIRRGGHLLLKTFDLFEPQSVGIVYALYRAFGSVCIFKPVTSRPANSERYVVCRDFNGPFGEAVADKVFLSYVYRSNAKIARAQIFHLRKLVAGRKKKKKRESYRLFVS